MTWNARLCGECRERFMPARLDQKPDEAETEDVELGALLERCAETACQRYRLPPETIRRHFEPPLDCAFEDLLKRH